MTNIGAWNRRHPDEDICEERFHPIRWLQSQLMLLYVP